jgi:hypothetical protein
MTLIQTVELTDCFQKFPCNGARESLSLIPIQLQQDHLVLNKKTDYTTSHTTSESAVAIFLIEVISPKRESKDLKFENQVIWRFSIAKSEEKT